MYFLIPVVFYLLFVLGVLALCMAAAKKPLPRGITVKAAIGSQCPAAGEGLVPSPAQKERQPEGLVPRGGADGTVRYRTLEVNRK